MLKKELLQILVCPICKQKVKYIPYKNELICEKDEVSYPIVDEIPVMLEPEAKKIDLADYTEFI